MRLSFFNALEEMARSDERIYLLTGDLGFRLFDAFRASHPERFVNSGIAEPNMLGVAAGLALSGKKVYCYSITPFITMRAYEQIRMDIAYQNLDVTLVGVGGGFTYGLEGMSHFGIEDISLMRSQPNMAVLCPADPAEAGLAAKASAFHAGPLYVRLGNNGDPDVTGVGPPFVIGKAAVLAKGRDAVIIATGGMVHRAQMALRELRGMGVSATLVNMHTLRPLDTGLVLECASGHNAIFTVEEHSVTGGLGSAVAEVLAESSYRGIFRRIGIPDRPRGLVGDAEYHRHACGLTAGGIAARIMETLGQDTKPERGLDGLEGQIRGLSQAVQ